MIVPLVIVIPGPFHARGDELPDGVDIGAAMVADFTGEGSPGSAVEVALEVVPGTPEMLLRREEHGIPFADGFGFLRRRRGRPGGTGQIGTAGIQSAAHVRQNLAGEHIGVGV